MRGWEIKRITRNQCREKKHNREREMLNWGPVPAREKGITKNRTAIQFQNPKKKIEEGREGERLTGLTGGTEGF